jgi:hypothetical protein
MAVTTLQTYQVQPNRVEEFTAVLSETKRLFEANGAVTRALAPVFAGEAVNTISMTNAFTDLGVLAAFGETLAQLEAPNPIVRALQSDDPPATRLSGSVLDIITPQPQQNLASDRAVLSGLAFQITTGRREEVMAALPAIQGAIEARGGEPRIFTQRWAGAATGLLGLAVYYESNAALAAADAMRVASDDRPVQDLVESGALTMVNSLIAGMIDL